MSSTQTPPHHWPKHPSVTLISGRRGSGKSYLIIKSLLRTGANHKAFDDVIIISPTAFSLDKAWCQIDGKGVTAYDE